jgi:hypothetical protein
MERNMPTRPKRQDRSTKFILLVLRDNQLIFTVSDVEVIKQILSAQNSEKIGTNNRKAK